MEIKGKHMKKCRKCKGKWRKMKRNKGKIKEMQGNGNLSGTEISIQAKRRKIKGKKEHEPVRGSRNI